MKIEIINKNNNNNNQKALTIENIKFKQNKKPTKTKI